MCPSGELSGQCYSLWMVSRTDQFHDRVPFPQRTRPKKESQVLSRSRTSIESIVSKLVMRIFDEYTNILRCMYSTRFNGGPSGSGSSTEDLQSLKTPTPSLIRSLESGCPDKFRRRKNTGVG